MISESRDQRGRLQAMRGTTAASFGIEIDDFDPPPFSQPGAGAGASVVWRGVAEGD